MTRDNDTIVDAAFTMKEFLEWAEGHRRGETDEEDGDVRRTKKVRGMQRVEKESWTTEIVHVQRGPDAHTVLSTTCRKDEVDAYMAIRKDARDASHVASLAYLNARNAVSDAEEAVQVLMRANAKATETDNGGDDTTDDVNTSREVEENGHDEQTPRESETTKTNIEDASPCDEDVQHEDPHTDEDDPYERVRRVAGVLDRSRDYIVDLTPRLLLCRGNMVNAMVRTSVSRYMEYSVLHQTVVGLPPAATTDDVETAVDLRRVPSSKRDVFKCKWLGLLEKRTLMHFLQFCNDFAFVSNIGRPQHQNSTASSDETHSDKKTTRDVHRQNETMLQQQRSLARPQNKKSTVSLSAATKGGKYDYETFKTRPFADMLKAAGMSDKLRAISTYAIAMACDEIEAGTFRTTDERRTTMTTEDAMRRVCSYVASLGRHGTTAFLCPVYGASEIPQSLCRLCAVNNGVYLLRENVSGLVVSRNQKNTTESHMSGVVLTLTNSRGPRVLKCDTVVTDAHFLRNTKMARRRGPVVVRLCAICSTPLIITGDEGDEDKVRCYGVVIPAYDDEDNAGERPRVAVRCLQLDAGVRASANGTYVVHLWATARTPSRTVHVATFVESVLAQLVRRTRTKRKTSVLYRATYTHQTYRSDADTSSQRMPDNLYVLGNDVSAGSVHLEDAYASAKKVFDQIVKDKSKRFLEIPVEREKTLQQNNAEPDEWGDLDLDGLSPAEEDVGDDTQAAVKSNGDGDDASSRSPREE